MCWDETIATFGCFRITLGGDDGKLLTSILNKAIRDIPERDKEKLISDFTEKNAYQYTASDFVYQYRFQIVIAALILIVAMVALALIANSKKKVRQAIEEDEKKLRNITNNIKGGVVVLKANEGLNIIFANNGFLKLIGCDRKQLEENGSYLAYVHPDDLGKIQDVINIAEREFSFNLRVLKTDGSYVSTLFNCTAGAEKNGSKELYCVILDLTEQEKLNEQLQIDKRRTELILNCVDEVFYEVNLQNHMVSTSVSFYEKFGWTLPSKLPERREDYITATWETDSENLNKILVSTREMLAKKEPISSSTHRILVAEDHPLNAEIIKKLLEKKGYDVERVANGKECVSKFIQAESDYYDAILMDIRMPVMDGIEAAKIIRKLTRADAQTVPIIAMTANAFADDIEQTQAAGMDGHLSKPIQTEELYATLIEKMRVPQYIQKQKVLVVDDTEANRAVIRATLEKDYDIIEAENGRQAMDIICKTGGVDAVITDIQMPEMDGTELIRQIRSDKKYRHMVIIANTQFGDPAQEERILSLGANDFVYKPTTPAILYRSTLGLSLFYIGGRNRAISGGV